MEMHGHAKPARDTDFSGWEQAKLAYCNIRKGEVVFSRRGYNSSLCGTVAAEADEDRWPGV